MPADQKQIGHRPMVLISSQKPHLLKYFHHENTKFLKHEICLFLCFRLPC